MVNFYKQLCPLCTFKPTDPWEILYIYIKVDLTLVMPKMNVNSPYNIIIRMKKVKFYKCDQLLPAEREGKHCDLRLNL